MIVQVEVLDLIDPNPHKEETGKFPVYAGINSSIRSSPK